ncbi:AAA family ATPase [Amphibacillus sp. Q70]|uniref:AAA family ATPase n=1 Tax=Amphibacillus sp. Q70 TaxID=3453416 RepID=UPI003F86179D
MQRFILYTYKNRFEFESFYKDKESEGYSINPFIFQETRELLEENPDTIIDISNLIQYLFVQTGDIMAGYNNLINASEDTIFIIKESLSQEALEVFNVYFIEKEPLYPDTIIEEREIAEQTSKIIPFNRLILYSYKNSDELDKIVETLNQSETPLISFSQIKDAFIENFKEVVGAGKEVFVDITSLVSATTDNANLIYYAEKIFIENPYFKIFVHIDQVEATLEKFKLVFKKVQPIQKLLSFENYSEELDDEKTIRIVDLPNDKVKKLIEDINENLFGHKKFKDQLPDVIRNFLFLNRLKEKKILSLFLLGNTGLGKTEFAALLKNQINPNTSLVKINFGNYSSQDALNSLIGSPRGFIGSEEGELSKKIMKSRAGIILCDEFEKANKQIFNFFLELLEDGVFTDSLSNEHNVDGYIIIFTSNLDKERFYREIPPEFQSRLDLVCEFSSLNDKEKSEYIDYFVSDLIYKINHEPSLEDIDLSPQEIQQLKDINLYDIKNIRDIKREVVDRLLKKYY